jgi:hypothetical protein
MGLDMYAYAATQANDSATQGKLVQREIAYWRKHPNLHGWMQQLWENKMNEESRDSPHDFNGIELELTWEDLEDLERAVTHKQLPSTSGFFFGNDSDDHYREHDLKFVREAKAEIFTGLKVFYNSSW